MTNNPCPPRSAEWLLERFLSYEDFDHRLGDFAEAFRCRVEDSSVHAARLWYWAQVLRSLPNLIKNTMYGSLGMIHNFFKLAFRNIRKHKVFSFINIAGLAVGLAMFVLISLYIRFELSFDRFHENIDRIVRVEQILDHNGPKEASAGCPTPLSGSLPEDYPEFEAVSRVISGGTAVIRLDGDQKLREPSFYVDSAFLRIFSFGWQGGDAAHALDAPHSVVLTESLAQKIFGHQEPVGQAIRLDDDNDYQVRGVIADVPDNSHITFKILISATTISAGQEIDPFTRWGDNWVPLYALLQSDVSWQQTSEKIQFALKKYQGEQSRNELYLRPLSRIHLYAQVKGEIGLVGSIKNIYIFTAIALFVLIIAGINFMNLTTARSADRAREVGLRKVSGAQRTSLIRQFLGESIYTAFLSLTIAFVLIAVFLPEFNRIVNRELAISPLQDWPFLLGVAALTLLVGILAGIYPAFVLSSFQPASVLKGRQSTLSRSALLRKALVVFQFFVSVTLISSTIIVLQQVHFLLHKDLGYDSEQVLTFPIFVEEVGTFRSFRSEVLNDPNVINVASHDYMPHSSTNWTYVSWEGAAEGEGMKMNVNYIDQDLMDTYGMTIVAGRDFSREFGADQGHVVILNEAAVEQIGWEEPIGKHIRCYRDYKHTEIGDTEVVGVVKDFHFLSLHNPVTPLMLRLYTEGDPSWSVSVKVREHDLPATIAGIETRFQQFFPEDVFNYRFLDEDFNRMYQEERKSGRVILYLAALAIAIACLGLFGLASFATKKRTKEIGIRKVVGASVSHITWLLNADFLKLTLVGCVLACPMAYFVMHEWLQNFLFRIEIQLWVFALASLASLFIALLTVSFQSLRAALANPIDSLRYE